MKKTAKLLTLVMSIIILATLIPSIPASAATYKLCTDTSPPQYRSIPGIIICPNGVIPSYIRTYMLNGGNTFEFAPGKYLIQGSANQLTLGSNTTIRGMVDIEQPTDLREIIYPNQNTQAIFETRVDKPATTICNAEERGYIYTKTDASNITIEDIFMSGYVCLKLQEAHNVHINNVVVHNYIGTWPTGHYCNLGYGTAVGSIWVEGESDHIYLNNCNLQMSFHHAFAVHTGNHSVLTRNVYLKDCRALHSGAGVLNGKTQAERDTAASRVPETGGIGYYDWSVGFDLCEGNSVDTVEAVDCYAWDAWKVGFYTEPYSNDPEAGGTQKNVKLINCRSDDAGQRSLLVGSNPLVTKVKETEACNFYFQGGYFENCVSYNGLKSGFLFGPEKDMGANPVLPGRLRLVNCVDRESAISLVIEMNGSRDVYINGFYSLEPENYAMRLYGSANFQLSNINVQVSNTSHPPIQIGHLLRQQITMSRDPSNICKVEMPPNPAHRDKYMDNGTFGWSDYGNYVIENTGSNLAGSVYNYKNGDIVTVYSNWRGTSKWNGQTSSSTIAASFARPDGSLPIEELCPVPPVGTPIDPIPPAPTGLTGVMPTSPANNDGQITGTSVLMEYKLTSAGTYTACVGSTIANLVPGTYNVRYKETEGIPASHDASVIVPTYSGPINPIDYAESNKHPDWHQYGYNLGNTNTGTQNVQFYVTPHGTNIDSQIAYIDSSTQLSGTGFDQLALQIRMNSSGCFDCRNGGAFAKTSTVNYSTGNTYFVEMTANMTAHTYSVWVTPPGGSKTQIANNYAFRSSAPTTDDLGKVFFISETANNLFSIEDHFVGNGKQTQNAPAGLTGISPTTSANNNGKIIGTTTAMEWKTAAGSTYTACTGAEITGLAAGDYDVRYKETDTHYASPALRVNVPKQNQPEPTGLIGVAPTVSAGNNGKITGTTTAMEYKLRDNPESSYTSCTATQTTGLSSLTYTVRYKETAVYYSGLELQITIPKQTRSAPSGLVGVKPTSYGGTDGKITGTTNEMEYKLTTDPDTSYASCTAAETTGLSAGNYDVRYKETEVYYVSSAAVVSVPQGDVDNIWYSKKLAAWTQYPISLGSGNTGLRVIEYDVTPAVTGIDGSVSYADTSTNVTGFSGLAMMVRFNPAGYFDVRNGSVFAKLATVNYAANVTYHVEIYANMEAHTYSVFVKPANGSRTKIASNYAFRSDAPATDDVGKVFLISEAADNQFSVTNHTVKAVYNSKAYPDCFEPDSGYDLGSSNIGTVTINYDIMPLISGADGSVGFADSSTMVDYFSDLAMMVRFNTAGYFDVRNGAVFAKTNTVNYTADARYHVRIVANMTAHTYSVWVTPYGGAETQIANNYAFRSDAPITDDVGQMFLPSEPTANQFSLFNLVISAQ